MWIFSGILKGHSRLSALCSKLWKVSNEHFRFCKFDTKPLEHLLTVCPILTLKRSASKDKHYFELGWTVEENFGSP